MFDSCYIFLVKGKKEKKMKRKKERRDKINDAFFQRAFTLDTSVG